MGSKELDQLKPALEAIPVADVAEPRLPIAIFLQEAHDLATLVARSDVEKELVHVGVAKKTLAGLDACVAAARQAESDWVVAFDRAKPATQRKLEDQATVLRTDLMAACRWNLRDDRVALATVSAVAAGTGLPDLVQDLNDLAHLIESRSDAFKTDKTFDAAAEATEAKKLAKELEQGVSSGKLADEQSAAKDLRDRAFTYLYDQVSLVREAGRYAFRGNDSMRGRFASAYKRSRSRAVVSEDPTTPGQPVAPAAATAPAAAAPAG
jgi:hypothetical protein